MTGETKQSGATPPNFAMQGGRLTKHKGVVASIAPYALAPSLALPMAFALSFGAASLMGTTALHAQGCVATATPGVFSCSGVTTTPQVLINDDPTGLSVSTTAGFSLGTTGGTGINLQAGPNAGQLTFTHLAGGDIAGRYTGIDATHSGSGNLTITTTGAVSADTNAPYSIGYAIRAETGATANTLTIQASKAYVSGGAAIFATSGGSGQLSITTTAGIGAQRNLNTPGYSQAVYDTTVPYYGAGIYALSYGAGGTQITTSSIYAFGEGIYSYNQSGALEITATGTITAGAETLAGIDPVNGYYRSKDRDGIEAYNYGTNLIINAQGVSGTDDGIEANNYGTGELRITTSGAVVGGSNGASVFGTSGNGIEATNYGTDLIIDAKSSITGNDEGIDAANYGSGSLMITATGAVMGGIAPTPRATYFPIISLNLGEGIQAYNSGTHLKIDVGDVSGYSHGIVAQNEGAGYTLIRSSGTVIGGKSPYATGLTPAGVSVAVADPYAAYPANRADGIQARTGASSAGLTIEAVNVHGGYDGIFADHYGGGALTITTTGTVSGGPGTYIQDESTYPPSPPTFTSGVGINVSNSALGTDLSLTTGDVSGYGDGIYALHYGTGALVIDTTGGTVTGGKRTTATGVLPAGLNYDPGNTAGNGITAIASPFGTGLSLSTGAVTGSNDGIYADSFGTGDFSITANGPVTGTNGSGIYAAHSGTGAFTVTTKGAVTGGFFGITAAHYGSGDVTITSSGAVQGGFIGLGGYAKNGNVSITAGTVTGSLFGIHVNTSGGDGTVDIAGVVTGSGGAVNMNNVGGAAKLILRDGFGLSGQAVTVIGDTDDTLELAGGGAGSGASALDLSSLGNAGHASGILGFENLSVTGGAWSLTGTQSQGGFTTGAITGGQATLESATLLMNGGPLTVGASGMLGVNGASTLTGGLSLLGMLSLEDNAGGDTLAVSGDFAGGGTVKLDVDFAAKTADQLQIAGNVSGATALAVTGVNAGSADGSDVTLVTVGGTTAAGDFTLDGAPLSFGIYTYDLALDTGTGTGTGTGATAAWTLRSSGFSGSGVAYQNALNALLTAYGPTGIPADFIELFLANTPPFQTTRDSLTFSSKGAPKGSGETEPLVWARSFGNWQRGESSGGGAPFSFDNSAAGVQVGVKALSQDWGTGTLNLGLFTDVTQMSGSASNANGTGSMEASAFGIGAAAVWDSGSGLYLGALAHLAQVTSDISSSNGGRLVSDHRSRGRSFAVEGGYRFGLSGTVFVTPQASLAYTQLEGGRFTDSQGTTVDLGSNDRLTGKIGAELASVLRNGAELYAAGFVSHDFSDAPTALAGSVTLNGGKAPTMFELSAGAELPLGEVTRLFVDGSYTQSFESGADRREAFSISAGLSARW